jgi:alkanesulfonate monooxygenase SsuD/methylene tetrahydromethanopterin reductase-like flavin-dependent oxidoreductase (luciferase family)
VRALPTCFLTAPRSSGRLSLVFIPGGFLSFDEALEIILKAWTTRERFSHQGRFWRFKNVVVEPLPKQAPHPPLWTAAGSAASIQRAAERGHNLLLDQFASAEMLGERIALFEAEVTAHGRRYDPMQVLVARDLVIVDNERER